MVKRMWQRSEGGAIWGPVRRRYCKLYGGLDIWNVWCLETTAEWCQHVSALIETVVCDTYISAADYRVCQKVVSTTGPKKEFLNFLIFIVITTQLILSSYTYVF